MKILLIAFLAGAGYNRFGTNRSPDRTAKAGQSNAYTATRLTTPRRPGSGSASDPGRPNPLQMLNPWAPPQYGTGEQSVAYNPFTGRYDQIKLFEIVF